MNEKNRGLGPRIYRKNGYAGLLWVLILFTPWWAWADAEHKSEPPTLSVRGEARLEVEPDQVSVSLGVMSQAKTAKKALAENSKAIKAVIDALYGVGLKKKDVSTRRFNVQPVWSSRPRNADSLWRAKIIAYRVNNSVQVTTTQLPLVGDVINAATTAGANQVQSVNFGLENPRQFRSQAIAKAVKNARADADVAAEASGSSIKGVKTIHLDQAVASIEQAESFKVMRSAVAEAAPAPPINAGDITVRASVSIVYELTP